VRIRTIVIAIACGAASLACGKKDETKPIAASLESAKALEPAKPVESAAPAQPAPSAKPVQHVELEIATVANTMTFDKTSMTVPAEAEVHLVLKNKATMMTLPHDWLLVKPGTEASVAASGLAMGEQAGYIDVRDKNVLAHTGMAKPGATTEVTFTAPSAPGKYPYICTTPGHYLSMKGVLTVTP
jgi:azurin